MASHSADGTDDKLTFLPHFWVNSDSHTQQLISYKVAYRGHADTPDRLLAEPAKIAAMFFPPSKRTVVCVEYLGSAKDLGLALTRTGERDQLNLPRRF